MSNVSRDKLVFEVSQFSDSRKKYVKHISSHFFNHAVSVIIPESERIPDEIEQLLNVQPHYVIQNLPASKLISEEFIEAFVKRGSLYMLSHEQSIDTKSCVALLPTGILLLHITKDLYQELGLVGQVSKFHSKTQMKYVVRIDLTAPLFQPGKKNFERVKWCLTERLNLSFNFLVTWMPNDSSICPSSIESYFTSLGFSVSLGDVYKVQHRTRMHSVPILESSSLDPTDNSCGFLEAYEWLGVVACGCDYGSVEDYVNTLSCPEPCKRQKVSHLKLSSFFAPQQIVSAVNFLSDWVRKSSVPWASFTVHGFMDSPVSSSEIEHGYHTNGDNLYTIIVFSDTKYWLYTATGSCDIVS